MAMTMGLATTPPSPLNRVPGAKNVGARGGDGTGGEVTSHHILGLWPASVRLLDCAIAASETDKARQGRLGRPCAALGVAPMANLGLD